MASYVLTQYGGGVLALTKLQTESKALENSISKPLYSAAICSMAIR